MEVIYGLIPSVIIVGGLVVIAIIWAAKRGQFDDLDGAGSRILMDNDEKPFAYQEEVAQGKDQSAVTNEINKPSKE